MCACLIFNVTMINYEIRASKEKHAKLQAQIAKSMKQLLTASQRKLVDYNPTINLFSLIQILQTELLPKVSYVQRESQGYF